MQLGRSVSARKVRRKLAADGPVATCAAGVELLSRKLVFTRMFATLFERGVIDALPRRRLLETAEVYPDHLPASPRDSDHDSPSKEETNRFVATIPDGHLFAGSGAVFTANGELVVDSLATPTSSPEYTTTPLIEHLFRDGPRFTANVIGGDIRSFDAVDSSTELLCPLVPRYRNYYHWTIETLPKLRLLATFRRETGREPTLLLPADPPSWMRESFSLLGGDDFSVRYATDSVYRANSVLLHSFVDTVSPEEHQWFKHQTARLRDDSGTDHSRRIYVSRAGARERRVHNDTAVLDVLTAYGFEPYRLEEFSVAEQVQLFADAEAVVGPHGAGLSNLVYSEDTTVVELFGDNRKQNFSRIAEAAGFEYHRLKCRQDGPDLDVDVSRLREVLETVVD